MRGFLIKDKHFALQAEVATVIAQIACDDNELPQGSPCSPVISNMIGHLLDARLARFAKQHKCTYSRYADDITFSTGRKDFPAAFASLVSGTSSKWQLSDPLITKIENSDFKINHKKTRMQIRGSRQVTTGLMVNEKVNIRPEYYRTARAMCHALFSKGQCYRLLPDTESPKAEIMSLNALEGMLAHIHKVKDSTDHRLSAEKKSKPTAARRSYGRFLFYKNFVALEAPVIVPEGKTDSIYLRAAIRKLPAYQPRLGDFVDGKFVSTVRFMNYSRTIHDVLQLGGGTGDLKHLILKYQKAVKSFGHAPLSHPVIIVIDNDDGAKEIFSVINGTGGPTISHDTTASFYFLGANLYLVKTPEQGKAKKSCIEHLFDPTLLDTVIDGKTFDPNKEHAADGKYGKLVFAERVVKPNANAIDFSGFVSLLDRIIAVLDDYEAKQAGSQPSRSTA